MYSFIYKINILFKKSTVSGSPKGSFLFNQMSVMIWSNQTVHYLQWTINWYKKFLKDAVDSDDTVLKVQKAPSFVRGFWEHAPLPARKVLNLEALKMPFLVF